MRQKALVTALIVAGLILGNGALAQSTASFAINGEVPIYEPKDLPSPIKIAVEDMANDMAKVFGTRPPIVSSAPKGPAIEIAQEAGPAESFSIAARGEHLVLSGADLRGTIYAIYTFSQDWLGVDPMYYWNDRQPQRKAAVIIPSALKKTYPAPLFKYRGIFINDEDQLTGWAPGERSDHSGISHAVMDKVFETILRLKGNMVVPGTWTFPTDPQMKWVSDRGLILTQHHAIPLGVNVARWPQAAPYSYSAHPEVLERAWTNAVRSYNPHQEILWSVGLRGLSDTSYATMDPSVVGNDKRQGALISDAIATQMRIVRAVFPNAHFVTDLWQEGARLKSKGYLKIPPEVTTVWADTGYGLIQDHGQVSKGQGMYYHVAMLNGRANQLSEMVPVQRIYDEFNRYIKAGATSYMLLNTSDIRAVSMTTRVVMDTAWGGTPSGRAADSYASWAADQFGRRAADAVANLWNAYFASIPKLPSGDDYGDQIYHTEARQLLMSAMIKPPWYNILGQAPLWAPVRILGLNIDPNYGRDVEEDYVARTLARELDVTNRAAPKWDKVWAQAMAAEKLVLKERLDFYRYYVLTGIAMNRDGNRMLLALCHAVSAAQAGDSVDAHRFVREAMASIDDMKLWERRAEYGKWAHWYRGEWLVGIDDTSDMVRFFDRWIDDPLTRLPAPVNSNGWQAYYHIMHYEGARAVDVH